MDAQPFFETENPLTERLGEDFFGSLPKTPGIYKMFGSAGRLLYVGKAKNLRNRLFTYRRAKPGRDSRKIIRLVRMVHSVEIEELPNEEEALLRENELIREHSPEFNHAKKQPHTYYYIVFRKEGDQIITDLRMHLRDDEREFSYGAFKGHVTVRRGLGAILRQLYIIEEDVCQPFDFPSQLLRNLTPIHYQLSARKIISNDWFPELQSFLRGESDRLLFKIMEHAQEHQLLEAFIGKVILKDMEALKFFYERCTRRNFEIIEALEIKSPLIPQEKLDDYLVKWAFFKEGG